MLYIRVQDNNVTPQVLVIELAPVFTYAPPPMKCLLPNIKHLETRKIKTACTLMYNSYKE